MKINEWNKLFYQESRKVLIQLRDIQECVSRSNLPQNVKNLRTKEQRKYLEWRQAALFCYGIGSVVLKTPVFHSISEASDYDCVALWNSGEEQIFTPIQLKELVPEALNSKTNLSKELEKLKKYVSSEDLVIALHVNRISCMDFFEIQIPDLKVAEVWLYGGLTPDQNLWFLYGNLLKEPQYYEFVYPKVDS